MTDISFIYELNDCDPDQWNESTMCMYVNAMIIKYFHGNEIETRIQIHGNVCICVHCNAGEVFHCVSAS